MADYYVAPKSSFDATADAIREKTGSSADIEWTQDGFADAIGDISGGTDNDMVKNVEGTMTSYYSDQITTVRGRAFPTSIESVELPNVTTLQNSAFAGATALTSIKLPKCSSIGSYVFDGCTSLTVLSLPSIDYNFATGWTRNCTSLATLDIGPDIDNLWNMSASNPISIFILRAQRVVPVGNTTSFNQNIWAEGGTGGDIYIPKTYYDHLGDGTANDYKAATNWSTIDAYGTITWHAIEGSYYETHYADGTTIPTI